jgi:two-component system cell cycle sensor histidine kinase/response regulator CckA
VIVEDVATETRFTIAPILLQHGIKSGMTVLIHGRERPYGVFGVQSKRLRKFTKEDVDYFQAAANVLASAMERLRTEEELRRSEESFRSLIEHAPEGILISHEQVIVYVNRALCACLGYERPEELLGCPVLDVLHPDDRETGGAQRMDEAGAPGSPHEMRLLRRDGAVVLAESVGVPIVFDGRQSIASMIRDVTERKRMEARLSLTDRLTSLGTLAAGVAHEINNPLAYVLGNLELLRGGLSEVRAACAGPQPASAELLVAKVDDLAGMVENAREGGERVRRIVADLKAFSRTEHEEKLAPIDARKVMASSINIARNEIRHRAELVLDYSEVPRVMANESRLGQVFLNLLLNAAQAIPDGASHKNKITVRIHWDADDWVVVEVHDTGAGIPPEILSRLFDPFFTTKPVGVGTGLGLAICHGIITGYGGDIAVESEVGSGTRFRITLPAAESARVSIPAPPPVAAPAPRGRVLIIDDEPFVAGVCRRMLANEHDVAVTTAAAAALSTLESGEDFDVILCDLMMPQMSGMELYEQVEQRFPHLLSRVVFLSGGAFSAAAQQFRERVPNLFLDKPCPPELLRGVVRERVRALRGAAAQDLEKA